MRLSSLFRNAACLVLFAAIGTQAANDVNWRVITPDDSLPDVIVAGCDVHEFGAKGDGSTDDTAAFQAALDRMAVAGGGTVFVPAGRYVVRGNLVIPFNVTLRGQWSKPAGKLIGTVLMAYAGRGSADGNPFITLRVSAAVKDLAIWYPEQDPANIVPYPFCLMQEKTGPTLIERITLLNPYQGISKNRETGGLLTVKSVYGSPLFLGIELPYASDIPRFENIHFSPQFWSQSGLPDSPAQSGPHADFMRQNGTGFRSVRADWIYAAFADISGYRTGLEVTPSVSGATSGKIYGFNVHDCQTALLINDVHETGLLLTACTFDGDIGIETLDSLAAALCCHSCIIRGKTAAAVLDGADTSATLFQDCAFDGTVTRRTHAASFIRCAFNARGDHLVLDENVSAVTMAGCTFSGAKRIVNRSKSRFVKLSDDALPASTIPALAYPGDRSCRPAKTKLFLVHAATGVTRDAVRDDTPAIQAALEEAGNNGGGIVLLPAAFYRVRGNLVIPKGVELRGINDGPHDSSTRGSVLAFFAGRGSKDGAPAIMMEAESGLRGVLCYYPEQKAGDITPYPPTIQGRGPNIYVLDVTGLNPYWFADFSSHRCDNHYLEYLCGSPVGICVSVGGGSRGGQVRNCQFVTHFWVTSPFRDNRPAHKEVIDYKKEHVEGFVVGSCTDELMFDNFVYGCRIGLRFIADGGAGADALVFGHGSDNALVGVQCDAAAPTGLRLIDTEMAVSGSDATYVLLGNDFGAQAQFFNTRFGSTPDLSAEVRSGELLFELGFLPQYGSFCANGGNLFLRNLYLHVNRTGGPEIVLSAGGVAKTLGCLTGGMEVSGGQAVSQYDALRGEPLPKNVREISTTLGDHQTSLGLVMAKRFPAIRCMPVERAGRQGWQSVVHPAPKKGRQNKIYYMTLGVQHSRFKNGQAPRVTIAVDYFDEGTGSIDIVYDSSDQNFKHVPARPGAWKPAGKFTLINTRQWKTYECTVNDALFGGRCNDNDIRLNIHAEPAPAVSAVRVTRLD